MNMLMGCGWCCLLLSIWAVVQLVVMGVFFKMEVFAFIEEAEPDHGDYDDYDDFMKKTKNNYHSIAINCWVGAAIYLLFAGISWICIKRAKVKDSLAAAKSKDDDEFCTQKSEDFS